MEMIINDLKETLADEIRKFRRGESTAEKVSAIIKGSQRLLSIYEQEIEYNRLTGQTSKIGFGSQIREIREMITAINQEIEGDKPK